MSDRGKGIGKRCQVSIEEMSESKPSDDASLLPQDTAKTGDDHWLQDQLGRYLFTVPMAGSRCIGGMTSIQALVSEMEVGPPESVYRGWFQTAVCG